MSSLETPTPRKSAARAVVERIAAVEDGAILKTVFFAMLAGAAWVLANDYFELNASRPGDLAVTPGDPMLPAVDRPEIDPDNPAYRPLEHITTPPEQLAEPLSIELVGGGVLMLSGTIVPGAATSFAGEIERRGDYVETVALNSPGGSVEDALVIGRLIRENGFDTAVGDGALCGSSCPLVLAGGVERIISDNAAVGVHQIYAGAGGDDVGSAQAMSDAQSVTARIARYLGEMGIDPLVWINAMETPPDRLYFLTMDEMEQTRLAATSGPS
ncbi:ATP-dependent Clp protease proteolytic subunit [Pelagibacterium flavum]|uniref:ATP-dependent Clp protease proteolytic subunit n=1 Tax=Pelagibacterium flavum TaxID=2984530 RepID=A0ABY6IP48_9HYPH|nr:ATP-dependent Clp protease proteolytic subunit [Pelagibacterium sp. YIM 151497]UYQ72388.1 ATP-dependent Clp protease proteolytic subunit [Pelagibacterium sp. YIM 151497]